MYFKIETLKIYQESHYIIIKISNQEDMLGNTYDTNIKDKCTKRILVGLSGEI